MLLFKAGNNTMKVLVIDSTTSNTNHTSLNFSRKNPSKEYIKHADEVLEILEYYVKKKVKYTAVHIAKNLAMPYTCEETHDNLNSVLNWALTQNYCAVYLGITICSKNNKKIEETEKLINLLGIPIICPSENNKEERDSYVGFTYCPSPQNIFVEYVSSIKNSWEYAVAIKGRTGSEKEKNEEYTSKLSALYLADLVNKL